PSLHCDEPRPELAATRFRVPAAAAPWAELPRRAGVSAFGFGGINAHIVLDGRDVDARTGTISTSRPRRAAAAPALPSAAHVLALAAPSIAALRAALDGDTGAASSNGPVRLALLEPTPERRALARKVLDRGKPWRGASDLWFAPRGFADDGGKLAFVFPGIDLAGLSDVGALVQHVGIPLPAARATPAAGDLRRHR